MFVSLYAVSLEEVEEPFSGHGEGVLQRCRFNTCFATLTGA